MPSLLLFRDPVIPRVSRCDVAAEAERIGFELHEPNHVGGVIGQRQAERFRAGPQDRPATRPWRTPCP